MSSLHPTIEEERGPRDDLDEALTSLEGFLAALKTRTQAVTHEKRRWVGALLEKLQTKVSEGGLTPEMKARTDKVLSALIKKGFTVSPDELTEAIETEEFGVVGGIDLESGLAGMKDGAEILEYLVNSREYLRHWLGVHVTDRGDAYTWEVNDAIVATLESMLAIIQNLPTDELRKKLFDEYFTYRRLAQQRWADLFVRDFARDGLVTGKRELLPPDFLEPPQSLKPGARRSREDLFTVYADRQPAFIKAVSAAFAEAWRRLGEIESPISLRTALRALGVGVLGSLSGPRPDEAAVRRYIDEALARAGNVATEQVMSIDDIAGAGAAMPEIVPIRESVRPTKDEGLVTVTARLLQAEGEERIPSLKQAIQVINHMGLMGYWLYPEKLRPDQKLEFGLSTAADGGRQLDGFINGDKVSLHELQLLGVITEKSAHD